MNFPVRVAIAPLPDAPAPAPVEPDGQPDGGFGLTDDYHVEFTPAGKTALALVSLRKRLAARTKGHLTARDRKNLLRHCKQLGFNEVWINFVLGVEQ